MHSVLYSYVYRVFSHRWIRLVLLSFMACAIALSPATRALGQSISFGESGAVGTESLPPSGVTRYGVLEAAWVESPVSKEHLFQIASPTVINRSELSGEQVPVEIRAQNIEDLLWLEVSRFRENALAELFNTSAETADITSSPDTRVIISTLQEMPVLQFSSQEDSRPLTAATVTPTDADFYGAKPKEVAELWKNALEDEMSLTATIYSPQNFRTSLQQAATTLAGLLCITGILTFLHWWFGRKQKVLKNQYKSEVEVSAQKAASMPATNSTEHRPRKLRQRSGEGSFINTLKNKQFKQLFTDPLGLSNKIDVYRTVRWVLVWLTVLAWYAGLYFLTTQLPILMQWRDRILIRPFILLVIWFLTSLAIRVSSFLIQRSINAWKERPHFASGDAHRQAVRSHTIAGALKGLATSLIIVVGILLTLTQFGWPVSSLLAGGALLGVALSFGAQNIIKDVVNGCLILIEDQFAVGDVVTINEEGGAVESLNLRLTQLRSADGELISIPNSNIALVKNLTSSWSRVNLAIEVAYETDVDKAISVIESVSTEMSQADTWKDSILEPPELLGVDDFGHSSVTLRLWIRTQPLEQWAIAREFRRRLKAAFEQAGILPPIPQRFIQIENTSPVHRTEGHLAGQATSQNNSQPHAKTKPMLN